MFFSFQVSLDCPLIFLLEMNKFFVLPGPRCRLSGQKFLYFFPYNDPFFSCKVAFIPTSPPIYSVLVSRSHIILQISRAFQDSKVQAP